MFNVRTYNAISDKGLSRFPKESYAVSPETETPDAFVLRSQKLHDEPIPSTVKAIARAGAGTNNVPVPQCTDAGIVVFNAPGANANAVKELVICGLLMASRDIAGGVAFSRSLTEMTDNSEMAKLLEKEKKRFAGGEISGKTLGVVGLGAIGAMVANAATELGMKVVGYDPAISVEAAWQLSRRVEKMDNIESLMAVSDFVTLHVPAIEATHHLVNAELLKSAKPGVTLLNFAREQIVDTEAVIDGLDSGSVGRYVTDFPTKELITRDDVVPMPHIGASTAEAEENCAIMVVDQLMDYLENGNIRNSVNFPAISMGRAGGYRLTFSNRNVPKVLGNVLSILADSNINVIDMINRSREDIAYNILDIESEPTVDLIGQIERVEGVVAVRVV